MNSNIHSPERVNILHTPSLNAPAVNFSSLRLTETVPALRCQTRLQVDGELNTLLMRLPNLLDSRVPDGDGEEENVVVSEWGQEYIKSGEVRAWSA